jgi:hypothetical protein
MTELEQLLGALAAGPAGARQPRLDRALAGAGGAGDVARRQRRELADVDRLVGVRE